MSASITINGIDELIKKFGNVQGNKILFRPMNEAVETIKTNMATYPPQPSGSTYRRTDTLGRRWTTKVTRSGGGLIGKVGNNTVYGPFVQSHQFQANVHQGRWQTDQQVMDASRKSIIADFKRAIDEALK